MGSGDIGHYGYPRFPINDNVGGAFNLYGRETFLGTQGLGELYASAINNQYYVGSVCALPPVPSFSAIDFDGSSRAAEAYSKMKPTKPSFEALNALYELKDLPGMLRQKLHSNNLKNIGNYYLALEFGWKPLLRDIQNLVKTQRSAQARLAQLLRDNGRPVRRSITLADLSSGPTVTSGTSYSQMRPTLVTGYYNSVPKFTTTLTSGERWWASARFRYHLPGGPRDIKWTRSMLARIYGLRPTPSVVYNAIPWSWLVDWFSNTGDLIENLDAGVADRLAASYFYVMREKWSYGETHTTASFKTREGKPAIYSGTSSEKRFRKTRVGGDPFGWNTSQASLNSMQLSILGALGLSRLR